MSRTCWTLNLGALVLLACAGQDAPLPAGQSAVTDTTLAASVSTDRAVYTRGEAITITLALRNTGTAPQTLEFSSGQRYDFAIEDTRAPVWRWSIDKSFIQVLGEETIPAGDSLIYRERFSGELPAGRYRAVGTVVRMGSVLSAAADFEIR
jgi:hypothetical protein